MVFQEMKPVIGRSVTFIDETSWSLGSMYVCEQIAGPIPANTIASWKENDKTFCIRPRSSHTDDRLAGCDSRIGKYDEAGTGFAAWSLSETVVCEVWAWVDGMPLEQDRLAFIRKNAPSVPVPEVVHNWVDRAWNREFYVRKRPQGNDLQSAWLDLDPDQIKGVAKQIAEHCASLAKLTSPTVENGLGGGMYCDPFLFGSREHDLTVPSWKPYILPILSPDVVRVILNARGKPNTTVPGWGEEFVFTHNCLQPRCVHVSKTAIGSGEVPRVTGITDWRNSGYMPRWWLATKAVQLGFFAVEQDVPGKFAWGRALIEVFAQVGFPREATWYLKMERWRLFQKQLEEGPVR